MRRSVDADKLMDGLGRLATDTDLCKRYGNCTPWIPYSAVRKLISDMILEAKESCDDAVSRQVAVECVYKALRTPPPKGVLTDTMSLATAMVYDASPIQPDIIRCKDCEFWTKQKDSIQGRCALHKMYPSGNWYCGTARRRGGQK